MPPVRRVAELGSLGNYMHMNEIIKNVAIILTPFLIVGAFFYFTRRHSKLQFFVLMPVLLVLSLRRGFSVGWRTRDYVDLGIVLFISVSWWLSLFRQQENKK